MTVYRHIDMGLLLIWDYYEVHYYDLMFPLPHALLNRLHQASLSWYPHIISKTTPERARREIGLLLSMFTA